MVAEVSDFGTARTMAKTAMTTQKGTYRWMALEIADGVEANINKMCDVFSFGMVIYEVLLTTSCMMTSPLIHWWVWLCCKANIHRFPLYPQELWV